MGCPRGLEGLPWALVQCKSQPAENLLFSPNCGVGQKMPFRCARCGEIGSGRGPCVCGFEIWSPIPSLSTRLDALPCGRTPRVSSGETKVDQALGGGFPLGSLCLMSGPRGSGKSRLALRWASFGRCLLVATEMPPELISELAPGAGVRVERVHLLTELPRPDELALELASTEAQTVVVDSASRCPARPEAVVSMLIRVCRQAHVAGIAIVHESARGRPRTRTDAEHDPDVCLRVTPAGKGFAQLSISKNRFAPTGSVRVTLGSPKLSGTG